jgi:hypothetical protein
VRCRRCKELGHNTRTCGGKTGANRRIPPGGNKVTYIYMSLYKLSFLSSKTNIYICTIDRILLHNLHKLVLMHKLHSLTPMHLHKLHIQTTMYKLALQKGLLLQRERKHCKKSQTMLLVHLLVLQMVLLVQLLLTTLQATLLDLLLVCKLDLEMLQLLQATHLEQ